MPFLHKQLIGYVVSSACQNQVLGYYTRHHILETKLHACGARRLAGWRAVKDEATADIMHQSYTLRAQWRGIVVANGPLHLVTARLAPNLEPMGCEEAVR